MNKFAEVINSLVVLILCLVLTGAIAYEYGLHETPCPLCFLQRIAMIGVGIGFMLNLHYGIRIRHYTISYFYAIFGASVSMRQILLHICPGQKPFGLPVFGLSLYSWAFIIFSCVIIGIGLLFMFYIPFIETKEPRKMPRFYQFVSTYLILITIANFIIVLTTCGVAPCKG